MSSHFSKPVNDFVDGLAGSWDELYSEKSNALYAHLHVADMKDICPLDVTLDDLKLQMHRDQQEQQYYSNMIELGHPGTGFLNYKTTDTFRKNAKAIICHILKADGTELRLDEEKDTHRIYVYDPLSPG